MNCDICESHNYKSFYPGIVKCSSCGHIYADQQLTSDQLKEIYNKDYFHGEEYSDYIAERDTIERNFKRISNIINKYITNKKYKNILEVGSAWFFLNMMKDKFISKGLEIFKDGGLCEKSIWCRCKDTDLLEWDFDQQKYDL